MKKLVIIILSVVLLPFAYEFIRGLFDKKYKQRLREAEERRTLEPWM